MELLAFVKFGTPLFILGMLLFLERINGTVNTIQEDVQEIKKGITWHDTCIAKHDEINRRLDTIERNSMTDNG